MRLELIMPDPTRVQHRHAQDVACKVIDRAERRGKPQALFLFADGSVRILDAGGSKADYAMSLAPDAFVGVYSAEARVRDIAEDVVEMERLH